MLFDSLQAVIIRVSDMPRACAFYRGTLELAELLAFHDHHALGNQIMLNFVGAFIDPVDAAIAVCP